MNKLKILTLALFTVAIAGCASFSRTNYYEPVKEDGWSEVTHKTGLLEFGKIPADVSYKCGDTSITVESVSYVPFVLVGPPFIPLFPVGGEGPKKKDAIVVVKSESPGNKTKVTNAVVVLGEKAEEPVQTLAHEDKAKSISTFAFQYHLDWQKVEAFVFQFETSEPKCGKFTVPYQYDFHAKYSMLGF